MFTLSSADLNIPHKTDQEINMSLRLKSPERITHDTAASCDDDGHVFVYDPPPNHNNEESTSKFLTILFLFTVINLLFS